MRADRVRTALGAIAFSHFLLNAREQAGLCPLGGSFVFSCVPGVSNANPWRILSILRIEHG